MSTADELESIDVVEFLGDFGTEEVASTTGGDGPRFNILGVGPHEVCREE